MKKTAVFCQLSVLAALMLFASACHKNDARRYRISKVTENVVTNGVATATYVYDITYSTGTTVTGVTKSGTDNSGYTAAYTYTGNTISVLYTFNDGSLPRMDSITMDSKKRVTNINTLHGDINPSKAFFYDPNNPACIVTEKDYIGVDTTPVGTSIFAWTDNDLQTASYTAEGSTTVNKTTFTYNGNGNIPGNYLQLQTFLQDGVWLFPTRHLVESITQGGTVTKINYSFGPNYSLSQLVVTTTDKAGNKTITTYSFQNANY